MTIRSTIDFAHALQRHIPGPSIHETDLEVHQFCSRGYAIVRWTPGGDPELREPVDYLINTRNMTVMAEVGPGHDIEITDYAPVAAQNRVSDFMGRLKPSFVVTQEYDRVVEVLRDMDTDGTIRSMPEDDLLDAIQTFRANLLLSIASKAEAAFWKDVASSFPEVETGDLDPATVAEFGQTCEAVIVDWVIANTI